ncbi:alpha-ribazole phosphatase family protein [Tolumonas lignilytica]|uniref:alpha-ribazole phosphatase family protein n=1 Tax=Tolumonas lignilytica TaxID=1283284 RepID=UPI000465D2A3|nr:alpha-ribazole phosphatase family protein [Tolumonas lignilytica]
MNSPYQSAIIDLLRHGSVAGDAGLYGHNDIALSEVGWQQMQQSVNVDLQYQQIFSSPLQRCQLFAQDYSQRHSIHLTIAPELKEMNFGSWDGLSFEQLQHCWADLEQFWKKPAEITPPNGESLMHFKNRITQQWEALLQQCKGSQTLVVTHAGVIRMILAQLLCVDWKSADYYQHMRIDYGSITRIQVLYTAEGIYPQIRFIGRPSPTI